MQYQVVVIYQGKEYCGEPAELETEEEVAAAVAGLEGIISFASKTPDGTHYVFPEGVVRHSILALRPVAENK